MKQLVKTTMSAKGQVVLPEAIRDAMGWGPGTKLRVEATRDGVRIYDDQVFPETSLRQVFGCLVYDGPAMSVEDLRKY
jgi:AbrB family looped-hinge helix DNA binding protein